MTILQFLHFVLPWFDYSSIIFSPFFSCSGPKRPHDKVAVKEMKTDFLACLSNPVGFKGYAISNDKLDTTVPFILEGQEYTLNHGTVLIAAITSCTNTSNPRYGIFSGNTVVVFFPHIVSTLE